MERIKSLRVLCWLLKGIVIGYMQKWCGMLRQFLFPRSPINTAWPKLDFSFIRYSQVWEDSRLLREGLQVKEGSTILSIASAGDNALALLLDNPRKVVAIDVSPSQLALCHLKVAAIKCLDLHEFRHLLGFADQGPNVRPRLEIYKTIHELLPLEAQVFWDKNIGSITNGIIHCGNWDEFGRLFGQCTLPLVGHSKKTISQMFNAKTQEDQIKFFDMTWDTWWWRLAVTLHFNEILPMAKPLQRSEVKYNVTKYYMDRFSNTLRNVPIQDNYFLEYVLTGEISGNNSYPDYLLPHNFEILKQRVDRLEIIHGDIINYCATTEEKFDGFNIDNVMEWLTEETSKELFVAIMHVSNPWARICYWNLFLARRGSEWFPKLRWEKEMSEALTKRDRIWLHSQFHVDTFTPVAAVN